MPSEKAELRKIYLSARKNLSSDERREKSRRVIDSFFENFDLTSVKFLHTFVTIERMHEIETRPIFERIGRDFPQITIVVPRVNRETGELENLKFSTETALVKNAWGIEEPGGNDFVAAEKIDLVLVPLLCFDRAGFRVGYGKGFYDKFLAKCRADCLKIGLSFFEPVEKISGARDFDVKLDFCVTPEKIWKF